MADTFAVHRELLPATSVEHSVFADVVGPGSANLVVARPHHVSVYLLASGSEVSSAIPALVGHSRTRQPLPMQATWCHLEHVATLHVPETIHGMSKLPLTGLAAFAASGLEAVDVLVLSFDNCRVSIVGFDPFRKQLKTLAMLNLSPDATGFGSDARALPSVVRTTGAAGMWEACVDPEGRCIAAMATEDQLALIPLRTEGSSVDLAQLEAAGPPRDRVVAGGLGAGTDGSDSRDEAPASGVHALKAMSSLVHSEPFVAPLVLMHPSLRAGLLRDMAFLPGSLEPTLAMLHEPTPSSACRFVEGENMCWLSVFSLDLPRKKHPLLWQVQDLPPDSFCILPVPRPLGGIMVLAASSVMYCNQSTRLAFPLNAFGPHLLAGSQGFQMDLSNVSMGVSLDAPRATWLDDVTFIVQTAEGATLEMQLDSPPMSGQVNGLRVQGLANSLGFPASGATTLSTLHGRWLFSGSRHDDCSLHLFYPRQLTEAMEAAAAATSQLRQALEAGTDTRQARAALDAALSAARAAKAGAGLHSVVGASAFHFELHDTLSVFGGATDLAQGLCSVPNQHYKALPWAPRGQDLVVAAGHNRAGSMLTVTRGLRLNTFAFWQLGGVVAAWGLHVDGVVSLPSAAGRSAASALLGSTGADAGQADSRPYHNLVVVGVGRYTRVFFATDQMLEVSPHQAPVRVDVPSLAVSALDDGLVVLQAHPHGIHAAASSGSVLSERVIGEGADAFNLPQGTCFVSARMTGSWTVLRTSQGAVVIVQWTGGEFVEYSLPDTLWGWSTDPATSVAVHVDGGDAVLSGLIADFRWHAHALWEGDAVDLVHGKGTWVDAVTGEDEAGESTNMNFDLEPDSLAHLLVTGHAAALRLPANQPVAAASVSQEPSWLEGALGAVAAARVRRALLSDEGELSDLAATLHRSTETPQVHPDDVLPKGFVQFQSGKAGESGEELQQSSKRARGLDAPAGGLLGSDADGGIVQLVADEDEDDVDLYGLAGADGVPGGVDGLEGVHGGAARIPALAAPGAASAPTSFAAFASEATETGAWCYPPSGPLPAMQAVLTSSEAGSSEPTSGDDASLAGEVGEGAAPGTGGSKRDRLEAFGMGGVFWGQGVFGAEAGDAPPLVDEALDSSAEPAAAVARHSRRSRKAKDAAELGAPSQGAEDEEEDLYGGEAAQDAGAEDPLAATGAEGVAAAPQTQHATANLPLVFISRRSGTVQVLALPSLTLLASFPNAHAAPELLLNTLAPTTCPAAFSWLLTAPAGAASAVKPAAPQGALGSTVAHAPLTAITLSVPELVSAFEQSPFPSSDCGSCATLPPGARPAPHRPRTYVRDMTVSVLNGAPTLCMYLSDGTVSAYALGGEGAAASGGLGVPPAEEATIAARFGVPPALRHRLAPRLKWLRVQSSVVTLPPSARPGAQGGSQAGAADCVPPAHMQAARAAQQAGVPGVVEFPLLVGIEDASGWSGVAALSSSPVLVTATPSSGLTMTPLIVPDCGPRSVPREGVQNEHLLAQALRASSMQPAGSILQGRFPLGAVAALHTPHAPTGLVMGLAGLQGLLSGVLPPKQGVTVLPAAAGGGGAVVMKSPLGATPRRVAYLEQGSITPFVKAAPKSELGMSGGDDGAGGWGGLGKVILGGASSRISADSTPDVRPLFAVLSSRDLPRDEDAERAAAAEREMRLGTEYVQTAVGPHRDAVVPRVVGVDGGAPPVTVPVHDVLLMKRVRDLLPGEVPLRMPADQRDAVPLEPERLAALAPDDMVPVHRTPLGQTEHGLVVAEAAMTEASAARSESIVMVGTGDVTPAGEDDACYGRVVLFKVAYVNAGQVEGDDEGLPRMVPKLTQTHELPFRAPVTGVQAMFLQGRWYIIIAAGMTVHAYRWEPLAVKLPKVGFMDVGYMVSDVMAVKDFLVMGDALSSIGLAQYRLKAHNLACLAENGARFRTRAVGLMVQGQDMILVGADVKGNVSLWSYNPAVAGTSLVHTGDMRVHGGGTVVTRLRPFTAHAPDAMHLDLGQPSTTPGRVGTWVLGSDGTISMMLPMNEPDFKRLYSVQKLLNSALPHTGGANPKLGRLFHNSEVPGHRPKPRIVDGSLVWKFNSLDSRMQREVARTVGTSRDRVVQTLREVDSVSKVV